MAAFLSDWSSMSEHQHHVIRRRLQAAKVLQFVLCLVCLGWLQTLGTSRSSAQPPSLDILNERVNRLSERDAETKDLMRAIVESQKATDRRVDEIYTRGSTLMGLIALISGYVAITGRKLRSVADRANRD